MAVISRWQHFTPVERVLSRELMVVPQSTTPHHGLRILRRELDVAREPLERPRTRMADGIAMTRQLKAIVAQYSPQMG